LLLEHAPQQVERVIREAVGGGEEEEGSGHNEAQGDPQHDEEPLHEVPEGPPRLVEPSQHSEESQQDEASGEKMLVPEYVRKKVQFIKVRNKERMKVKRIEGMTKKETNNGSLFPHTNSFIGKANN
jgi:hypothetical protein